MRRRLIFNEEKPASGLRRGRACIGEIASRPNRISLDHATGQHNPHNSPGEQLDQSNSKIVLRYMSDKEIVGEGLGPVVKTPCCDCPKLAFKTRIPPSSTVISGAVRVNS